MTPDEWASYYDRCSETALLNRERLKEAADLLNDVFVNDGYQMVNKILPEDIEFTYHFLTNRHYSERNEEDTLVIKKYRKLTQIVFDYYYPVPKSETFYHYTKLSSLRGILKNELKLKPLITNENFDEFKTFYKDHNLIGYQTSTDESGKLMERVLMEQCFAICFAMPEGLTPDKEDKLWTSFGDTQAGVKIEFEIKTEHVDFRKIFYRDKSFDKSKLLLNRLVEKAESIYGRIFTVAGLSKIGAFYLPGIYNVENEARFLIKKFTDDYDFDFNEKDGHIILPFKSKYAHISIKSITAGSRCNIDTLQQLISESPYKGQNLLK